MATRESRDDPPGIIARSWRTFHGPNPYSRDPVFVARLEFSRARIADGPDRCARMAAHSATWFKPPASFDDCDTPLGITRFLLDWALAALNRHRGFLHAASAVEEDGAISAVLGFHNYKLSGNALALAIRTFGRAHRPPTREDDRRLKVLWQLCVNLHPDYQVTFLMQAARAAGIPYMSVLPTFKTWQFGWGARSRLFLESQSSGDSAIGERLSRDKPAGKAFLRGLGIPVPPHKLASSEAEAVGAGQEVGWPCIVKPVNGGRSVGVTTDIADDAGLAKAVRETIAEHGAPVMIERQVPGEVYRILVAGGRIACVVRRAAPHVVGDGARTVRELIAARNQEQAGLRRERDFVGKVPDDEELRSALAREGLALDDVPARGRKLALRRIPLLSSGAVYSDVTAETHPETARMAETIADAFGIETCGIDFITTDIGRSMAEEGAVLEANTMPGLRVPMMAGLDMAAIGRQALGERPGRIPASLLVAPRETLAALRESPRFDDVTGWVVDGAAGIGTMALPIPVQSSELGSERPSHRGATMIVRNPLVEKVFVAVPLAELVEDGLPLDRFDTIVWLGEPPGARWEAVMREASESCSSAKDLGAALRKCGLAVAPAQASRGKPVRRGKGRAN